MDKVCEWIRENFSQDAKILDINAGDGKWKKLLPEYTNMDAVDGWEPNCFACRELYRKTFHKEAAQFQYEAYDLIIINMEYIADPQKVMSYAFERCKDLIVDAPVDGLEVLDGCYCHKKQPKRRGKKK